MKNETSLTYFYLLPFSERTRKNQFLSAFFFLIYVAGVVINSSIITVICLDVQLHKPMYLFICHLSIVDIFYTSVTVPKLLYMLLSGDHLVPSAQCYAQLYCFFLSGTAEEILLFVMAYDRYVAICRPLHYQQILSYRNCLLITIGICAVAFCNSVMFVLSVLYMSSCCSNIIRQFYCDPKSLTRITCTTSLLFIVVNIIEIIMFAFVPLMGTFISYVKIFCVIFGMRRRESRSKAFSTCSSHVIVISIYYGTSLTGYLIPSYSEALESAFNAVYTTIVPMINPIIYSLQNNNVQSALMGLVKKMCGVKKDSGHLHQ